MSRYRLEGNNLFPAILKSLSEPLETNEWMNEQKPASPYLVLKLAISNFALKWTNLGILKNLYFANAIWNLGIGRLHVPVNLHEGAAQEL